MSQVHKRSTHPGSEDKPPTDTTIESYVRAIEGLDAGRVAGPAAALAELLEARLGGTEAPQARQVLDDLVAGSDHESRHPRE